MRCDHEVQRGLLEEAHGEAAHGAERRRVLGLIGAASAARGREGLRKEWGAGEGASSIGMEDEEEGEGETVCSAATAMLREPPTLLTQGITFKGSHRAISSTIGSSKHMGVIGAAKVLRAGALIHHKEVALTKSVCLRFATSTSLAH